MGIQNVETTNWALEGRCSHRREENDRVTVDESFFRSFLMPLLQTPQTPRSR